MDFNLLINTSEYDFLITNPHLGENIILLTLGGSHAYGTNIETSDVDIRGCALNRKCDLLGLSEFKQVENNTTDTTIYSFNRLISLLLNVNPNTIEMLGCKPEHYLVLTDIGKSLIDNRKMFLSKKVINSFGGYANQQLRRLQNALARDSYLQAEKEKHILGSIKSSMVYFEDRYKNFDEGSIELSIDKSDKENLDEEIFMDINLNHYPLRDYKSIWSDMNAIAASYSKLKGRNHKKDDLHLNKHAMHLIRLYMMCLDILEKEEIITYREKEHELLISIRNGKYQKEDGTFYSEFFEMVDSYEKRLTYARQNTSLPQKPNMKQIEEFVISVNEFAIKNTTI